MDESQSKKRGEGRALLVATAAALAAIGLCCCLAACQAANGTAKADDAQAQQPTQAQTGAAAAETKEADAKTATTPAAVAGNFLDVSTGDLPDNYQNQLQNTGNRGCNACHADLLPLLQQTDPKHIIDYVGYGKPMTYADCQPCHDFRWGRAGSYFGDSLHGAHYSNEAFLNTYNGNCWSCHATLNGEDKEVTWELWDEVKYDPFYAGYDAPEDPNSIYWVQSRGISDSGYLTGVQTSDGQGIQVEFSQPVTDEADMMEINNWQSIDINGTQWYLDGYDYSDWKLEVTGVKNPRSFTLDELRALPQTEETVTQCCETTGLGCATVFNVPVKGVLIADLVEACGGIDGDEAKCQMFPVSADTWTGEGYDGMSLATMVDNDGMVALQFYGHDLTDTQGAPACVIAPGAPGAAWVKHIVSLDFRQMDDPAKVFNPYDNNKFIKGIYPVNSGFFENDGVTFKVGEPVKLTGYSFSWNSSMGAINKVSFSLDYGETWTDFVPPADLDPNQWTYWDFSWAPDAAGTYIVKVMAESEDGSVQVAPVNIIVTVE